MDLAELVGVALFDAAPDAMLLVDEAGTIVLVNEQTERVFGFSRAELVGKPIEALIPSRFREGHLVHRQNYGKAARTRAMGIGLELWGQHRDGREIPVEIALAPITTPRGRYVSAAVRDISARRAIEDKARVTHERLLSALESVQDAIAIFDADDRLVLCNSVYRCSLPTTWTGPVVGASYATLLDAERATRDRGGDTRASTRARRMAYHDAPTGSIDVRTRDGRSLRVVDRITPERGRVRTIYDLTDDVRRQTELDDARRTAEAANAAKTEFLRSMSHELRTPLNAVLGFTQLIQRDPTLGERPKRLVEHVARGGEHLLRLIDDVLDLARVEAGAVPLSLEPVALSTVLAEVRTTLAAMAQTRHIRVMLDEDNEPLVAHADRTRLVQIVLNFGSNALKYGKTEGEVVLRAGRTGDRARISVRDDGPGIPRARQDRLFQVFYRAGQETGPIEGTGIGLALSQRLASMMEGRVGFESQEGAGSEFWVELPLERAQSTPTFERGEGGARREGALRDATVLYVEDNPANLAFMEELMMDFPHVQLLTAPTGELGLDLAVAVVPTVVILDINLPGMSGFEVLRHLRANERTRAIPVVALSASAMQRDVRRAEEAGFARYLTKPVKVDELVSTLESLLERR